MLQSTSFNLASVRYRCFYAAYGLSRRGHSNEFFTNPDAAAEALSRLDALVIVKRLDGRMMNLAARARARDVPIIFDLCDDVISPGYRPDEPHLNRMLLSAITSVTDVVVTTGQALSARLRESLQLSVLAEVPDVCETPELMEATRAYVEDNLKPQATRVRASRSLTAARLAYFVRDPVGAMRRAAQLVIFHATGGRSARSPGLHHRLRRIWRSNPRVIAFRHTMSRLKYGLKHPDRAVRRIWIIGNQLVGRGSRFEAAEKAPVVAASDQPASVTIDRASVVWFGNHGAPHSNFGMLSLLGAAEALRKVDAGHPLELVVISSHRRKFDAFAAALGVPARYVEWSADAVHAELARASVALLTAGDDRFSEVKSANRTLLALDAGVPVVASMSPALEPLRCCIETDIEAGLRRYLSDPARGSQDVKRGREIVQDVFGIDRIAESWEAVVEDALARREARKAQRRRQPTLACLIEDEETAQTLLPVVDAARDRGLVTNLIVSETGARTSSKVIDALIERRIIPTMVSSEELGALDGRWLRDSDVLLLADGPAADPRPAFRAFKELASAAGVRSVEIAEIGDTQPDDLLDMVIASDARQRDASAPW